MKRPAYVLSVSLVLAAQPHVGWAQEDFRAADLDRPIRVEDAYPIKFREWEFEIGSRGTLEEGSRGLHGILEVKTGVFRNTQFGIEVESAVRTLGSGADTGLESASAHLLYGIRRETVSMPAMAIRLEGATPGTGASAGVEATAGIEPAIKVLQTSALPLGYVASCQIFEPRAASKGSWRGDLVGR